MTEPGPRGFVKFYLKPFRDCFVFSGRSTRSEVGAFYLFSMLANMITVTLTGFETVQTGVKLAWAILWLLPWFSLTVRRLHDQNRPGYWGISAVAVMLGIIAIAALMPQSGDLSPSFGFLIWKFHPVAGPMTTTLFAAGFTLSLAMLALLFWAPTRGPNRYGPDPREADHQPCPEPAA